MIDYQKELNYQQFDAVQNGDGPCLVLAGAGSGKTRTITYRVAWLLEHGVIPESILLLTFTNKAAREMIERVETLLHSSNIQHPTSNKIWAGTFHSVANRLLRKYASRLGFGANFTILDQEDSRDLISLCLRELNIDYKDKRFPKPAVLQDIISYAANKRASTQSVLEQKYARLIPLCPSIEMVAQTYARLKRAQNAMDFDDLLWQLRKLLVQDNEICQRLAEQFHYILVDEFQDTNAVQAEIVDLLGQTHKNIFVVGDDAQSIYSFRAANIQNILTFPERYPGANVFKLTANYRSTPQILALANASISQNNDQFAKDLQAVAPRGAQPFLYAAPHAAREAAFVADEIVKRLEGASVAVLFRAAFHSQALEFELLRRHLVYDYRGGMKFFERAHIKDVVAILRLLQNPKDVTAWMRLLRVYPGIGLITAQKIAQTCGQVENLKDALLLNLKVGARAQSGLGACLQAIRAITQVKPEPADLIRAFVATVSYQDYLAHEYQNASERLDDLEQFALFAKIEPELERFLEIVSLTQEYEVVSAKPSGTGKNLILSTIHQAKGLEWDTVFVINLAEKSFPHQRVLAEDGGLEEERRLFYVAITRAKKELFLTYPQTSGYDSIEYNHPSLFLEELPSGIFKKVGLTSVNGLTAKSSTWEEPVVVLDSSGERVRLPAPGSFLRNLDEL